MKHDHYIRLAPFKAALLASIIGLSAATNSHAEVIVGSDLNSTTGSNEAINALFSANRGSNGGGDQSLQFGDVLNGTEFNDLIVGGLGIDVLFGKAGDDVMVGGTEDFNGFNRDPAFGEGGDDTFIWAPGDGNDVFDGGDGKDVVILSLVGEKTDAAGNTAGAPFFGVSAPGNPGTGDFDGIYVDAAGDPAINLRNSPGFCEIVEKDATNAEGLKALDMDHLIRFVLRGPRQNFNNALAADPNTNPDSLDSGLRVAVQLHGVEYLVCGGPTAGSVEIYDLTQVPAALVDISQLPSRAQRIVTNSL